MKTNNNFSDKCPTAVNFEVYLKDTGSIEFMNDFKLHLNSCELCNQAIQGYQAAGLTEISATLRSGSKTFESNINTSKKVLFKIVSVAASIIILLGFSAIYFTAHNNTKNNQTATNIDYSFLIENPSTAHKTLVKKTNDHFIYIGSCDKIAYNDQILSSQELLENLKEQKNINLITVEVATNSYECATQLINSIKLENVAPIITISNSKGIKKLTPWGGGLGG